MPSSSLSQALARSPRARSRPGNAAIAGAALAAAALALAIPGRALAQAPDPVAEIRADAARLVDDGRYHDALLLLRAIDLGSLPADRALELKGWIADIDLRRARRLDDDLAEAERLRAKGTAGAALEVLAGVARYGSPADRARADLLAEEIRGEAAAREAAAAAARRAAEEEARRAREAAAAAAADGAREVEKIAGRWLEARKKLTCASCRGAGKRRCNDCEGRGKERVINVYGPGSTLVDCRGCNAQGIVLCGGCSATGLTPTRFDDVLLTPFAPDARKPLGPKTRFTRQVTDALGGKDGVDAAVAEHVARQRFSLDPVLGASEIEVRIVPGEARARVRYAVATASGQQREERVIFALHADGAWYLEPGFESAPLRPAPGGGAAPGR